MSATGRRARGRFGAIAGLVLAILAGCGGAVSPSPPAPSVAATASPASSQSATARPRPTAPPADAALEVVVDGLSTPLGLVPVPGTTAAVVLEQDGRIWVLEGGRLRPEPFLDLRDRIIPLMADYDERGLLGLAFDPDFDRTRRFFVYYGAPLRRRAVAGQDHTNRLSEVRVHDNDPLTADPATERTILEFEQPQPNHSGGGLAFGPDGLLYLGTGDGGGSGDASPGHAPEGNAQDPTRLNGKILRLDVRDATRGDEPYAVPPDNPFHAGGGAPEIFALGFRNPWRLAFEPAGERRLLVSDVGYGRYEEIDVVTRGGNYGWRIREGRHCLDVDAPLTELAECATTGADGRPLVDPVVEYRHDEIGIAVVGGYVYRGRALPELAGRYVFADFTRDWKGTNPTPRATLLVADPAPGPSWDWRPIRLEGGLVTSFITGLGEAADGELFVLTRDVVGPSGTTGRVLRLVPASGGR